MCKNANIGIKTPVYQTQTTEEEFSVLDALNKNKSIIEDLNNVYLKSLKRIINKLNSFSKQLNIDYHVVLIDENKQKRYSIIEKKTISIGCRDINFGVVGTLLKTQRENYESIFVQFGSPCNIVQPMMYTAYEPDISLEKVEDLFTNSDDVIWNSQEKIFAIAATRISHQNKIVGALSFDFRFDNESIYPNFSFREPEIRDIFDALYTSKKMFENLVYNDYSKSIEKIMNIINGGGE